MSPPVRGRGLKLHIHHILFFHHIVAPRAGAWIETRSVGPRHTGLLSPPVRGRGLKLFHTTHKTCWIVSPPVRGRGLKQLNLYLLMDGKESPPVRGRGLKRRTII